MTVDDFFVYVLFTSSKRNTKSSFHKNLIKWAHSNISQLDQHSSSTEKEKKHRFIKYEIALQLTPDTRFIRSWPNTRKIILWPDRYPSIRKNMWRNYRSRKILFSCNLLVRTDCRQARKSKVRWDDERSNCNVPSVAGERSSQLGC